MREHKIDPCGNPKKTKKIALENAIAILTLSLFYLKLLIYCIGFKIKFSKISTFNSSLLRFYGKIILLQCNSYFKHFVYENQSKQHYAINKRHRYGLSNHSQ